MRDLASILKGADADVQTLSVEQGEVITAFSAAEATMEAFDESLDALHSKMDAAGWTPASELPDYRLRDR